jgi:hypothetical protein
VRKPSNAHEQAVHALMEEKTYLLTKAQALRDVGMEELARPLWLEIAGREEQIAPLLAAMGRKREAAVHRISAASCYARVDDYARAANLYQAALAGPLLKDTRHEVYQMLERCLTRLVPETMQSKPSSPRRTRKGTVATES